jgi:hypothetical protein
LIVVVFFMCRIERPFSKGTLIKMNDASNIFEKNDQRYREKLAHVDFESIKDRLGAEMHSERLLIPFFNKNYYASKEGILDASGNRLDASGSRADYAVSVVLSQYVLRCPDQAYHDSEWVSFKDFKKISHFTNVNYFSSDTEKAVEKHFSGRLGPLRKACEGLAGLPTPMETPYDLSMQFKALPRISLLLLFNDGDEEFPAKCTVLFQKHAEHYLDPESLAMTSAFLAKALKNTP